ncbi:MAG: PrsW family intramembrane metalloprotease, partial [Candidatus Altiarchaeota archaeon]|nr:PrsW family intramembrane metalloprotease [Candidatus Altiarchaeota archaeon]
MEKVVETRSEFNKANVILVCFLLLLIFFGLLAVLVQFFVMPFLLSDSFVLDSIKDIKPGSGFSIVSWAPEGPIDAEYSPVEVNLTLGVPALEDSDKVEVYVVSDGRRVQDSMECVREEDSGSVISCVVPLKFMYDSANFFDLYPVLSTEDGSSSAGHFSIRVDWRRYIPNFWSFSVYILAFALLGAAFSVVILLFVLYVSRGTIHEVAYRGEYSLRNILSPFTSKRTSGQKYWWLLTSPLFWTFEMIGVIVIILYMAFDSVAFKSAESLFSFVIAGALALPIPLLFVAIFWFSDYKEREPLPMLVSLMLWGCLSCLLVIGLNSIGATLFMVSGVGFLFAPFVAPLFEELFKGMGLVFFSLHHEFDDVVDGIVYGFTIGMGFTFIENWFYLVENPVGADVFSWILLYFMRSLFFAANHGVFTAFTGAAIGFLKQRKCSIAPYGIFIGILPAMFLHFAHNFMIAVGELCGQNGCEFLVSCTRSPDADVRRLAASALGKTAVAMLAARVQSDGV